MPGLLAAALTAGCGHAPPERVLDQESDLVRQIEGLRELVARAERGSLVASDGLIVAVREDVVRRLAQLALPREVVVERFRVRLERADVRFRDRHGAVRLEGRVTWADDAKLLRADAFVDLTLFGHVEVTAVDAAQGTLTAALVPFGFEIERVSVGEEQATVRQLAEGLARALPEGLGALRTTFAIPVAFEHEIRLDRLEAGPLRLRPASLPLRLRVQDAAAHSGRLWVSVRIDAAGAGGGH